MEIKCLLLLLSLFFLQKVYSQNDSITVNQEDTKVLKNNLIVNVSPNFTTVIRPISYSSNVGIKANATYIFNSNKFVGLGVKLEYFSLSDKVFIPIAFVIRTTLIQKTSNNIPKCTLYLNTAMGYSIANSGTLEEGNNWGGGYICLGFDNGFPIGNKWEILLGFDYTLQWHKYKREYFLQSEKSYLTTGLYQLVGIQIGVDYRF